MKMYQVEKVNINNEKTVNYGIYDENDVKLITRGYKFNGLFYERKNSNSIYLITEIKQ